MQTQVRSPTMFIMQSGSAGLTVHFCDNAIFNLRAQARFKSRADLDHYVQKHHPGSAIHRVN